MGRRTSICRMTQLCLTCPDRPRHNPDPRPRPQPPSPQRARHVCWLPLPTHLDYIGVCGVCPAPPRPLLPPAGRVRSRLGGGGGGGGLSDVAARLLWAARRRRPQSAGRVCELASPPVRTATPPPGRPATTLAWESPLLAMPSSLNHWLWTLSVQWLLRI